jgi:hypothetical protein
MSSPGRTMTNEYDSAFSRRDAPEVCRKLPALLKTRAQGRPGARCTRGLVCNVHKEVRTRAYRSSGEHPAFPARWFYGLCRALPGDRHRRLADNSADLTPASGRQDHTILPYAQATLVSRSSRVHRISPHVRDDREPPLLSGETRGFKPLICPTGPAEYFHKWGLTGFADLPDKAIPSSRGARISVRLEGWATGRMDGASAPPHHQDRDREVLTSPHAATAAISSEIRAL